MLLLLISLTILAVHGAKECRASKKTPDDKDKCISLDMTACLSKYDECIWTTTYKLIAKPVTLTEGYPDNQKPYQKKYKKGKGRPELVWTESDMKALKKQKFSFDHIITLDAVKGVVKQYEANPAFVKGKSDKDFETLAALAVKKANALTKRKTRTRRLLENEFDEEELFPESLNDRRRLARDVKAETGDAIGALPYSAVGELWWSCYYKDTDSWGGASGVAAIIESVEEGGQKYDYILTAAHNIWWRDIGNDDANKDPANTKHFSRKLSFYRARNDGGWNSLSHGYWNLQKVWIGGNYKTESNKKFDWAILKYKTDVDNSDHAALFKYPGDLMNNMKLIGYRDADGGKQSYNSGVVPDDAAVDFLYEVQPYYTEKGVSGSPLFQTGTNYVVAVHSGNNGKLDAARRSVHVKITRAKAIVFTMIVSTEWDRHAERAFTDWNVVPEARYVDNGDILMNQGYVAHHHGKSLHRKESQSESALDLNIPNHDVNIHHYYHHEHEYENKYDTYSDGYTEYDYNYEQTKLLLAIPLILLTICVVCIGCLCCAGFGGIAGWFIQRTSKGSIKNRKNDYIQALNDNEVSEI